MNNSESPASIHAFWFGDEWPDSDDAAIARHQARQWWGKDETLDAAMRERFAAHVEAAAAGQLDAWAHTPRGRLALILLTDQFPRNMYRDTALAFSHDSAALAHARAGLKLGQDRALRPGERVFFYLPFEHSEELADQDESVRLTEALAREAAPDQQETFDEYVRYAIAHRRIIARFGRFPHRNRIMGRASTEEEIAFLNTPGSSF